MTLEHTLPPSSNESAGTRSAAKRQRADRDGFARPTLETRSRRKLHRLSLMVLVVGLVVTGVLTVSSRLSYLHDEQHLSELQANLTASAIGIAPVDLERRLGQAAAAAGEASDPAATFRGSLRRRWLRRGPLQPHPSFWCGAGKSNCWRFLEPNRSTVQPGN